MSGSRFLWEPPFLFKENFEQCEMVFNCIWRKFKREVVKSRRIIVACYVCFNAICVRKVGKPQ